MGQCVFLLTVLQRICNLPFEPLAVLQHTRQANWDDHIEEGVQLLEAVLHQQEPLICLQGWLLALSTVLTAVEAVVISQMPE